MARGGKREGAGRKKGSTGGPKLSFYKSAHHVYEALIGSLREGSFYVYAHYHLDTCFYVGKGQNGRAWDRGEMSRNELWSEYMSTIKNNGDKHDVRIIAAGLTEKEALMVEAALIKARRPPCNILCLC